MLLEFFFFVCPYSLRGTARLIAVCCEAWLQAPWIGVKSELALKHLTCWSDYCQNRLFRSSFWLFNLWYHICTNFLGQESLIMLGLCLQCSVNTNALAPLRLQMRTLPSPLSKPRSACFCFATLLSFWLNADILTEEKACKQGHPVYSFIHMHFLACRLEACRLRSFVRHNDPLTGQVAFFFNVALSC